MSAKPVGLFALQALVLTLLIGFWPTPREAYPPLFHAHANALLAWTGSPELRLEVPAPGSGPPTDTVLVASSGPGEAPSWRSWFSVGRLGWWPSAALVALLLATPLSSARRAAAIVVGLVALDALALTRIGVEILYASHELAHGPGEPASGAWHLLLRVGSESLTATIPSAAAVLVCWVWLASPWRTIDLSTALRRRGDT